MYECFNCQGSLGIMALDHLARFLKMLSCCQFNTSRQRTSCLLNTDAPPARQCRLILPQISHAPSIPQFERQSQNTSRNDPLHFQSDLKWLIYTTWIEQLLRTLRSVCYFWTQRPFCELLSKVAWLKTINCLNDQHNIAVCSWQGTDLMSVMLPTKFLSLT